MFITLKLRLIYLILIISLLLTHFSHFCNFHLYSSYQLPNTHIHTSLLISLQLIQPKFKQKTLLNFFHSHGMSPNLKTRKKSIVGPTAENVKWIRQILAVFYIKRSLWNFVLNKVTSLYWFHIRHYTVM